MSNCTDENLSCEEQKLGDSQLFRRLLRKVGNCLAFNVINRLSNPLVSSTTDTFVTSAEPAGSQTLSGLITAYNTWKASNQSATIVRELFVSGGDGITSIKITYIN
jgi:hypothetical protein